ncbi:hypothetical protein EW145_g6296 [Phellinidium pouzarii]|uniref:Arrestin C-terminal-like domain-containing protein n=1 Tax=Phellinidium pouzarii TaxID=167371 RepID=A0A4S4L1R3_9AGAM|nr:hypothetical protein EW145_g6296 [Phellinidium pouzarii]
MVSQRPVNDCIDPNINTRPLAFKGFCDESSSIIPFSGGTTTTTTWKMAPKNLSIRLTESVVFLRGSVESTVLGRRTARESPPAMLRGLLMLNLDKPTKISSIEITLEGKSQSSWPDVAGGRKLEVAEEHEIFSGTTVYFRAGKTQSGSARRTASVGPGLVFDHEENEDDSTSNEEARRNEQHAGPLTPPAWLSNSRRRVSMDYQFLHLSSRPSRTSLDDIPTPPYSPPNTRSGSSLVIDSNQPISALQSPIGHQPDPLRAAGSDSVHSSRILEDQPTTDHHGSHADWHNTGFSSLSREVSEPQSASSSTHSPSTADLSLSRRESVAESAISANTPPYERSRSRGRPRLIAVRANDSGSQSPRTPSLVQSPSTAPTSPAASALAHSHPEHHTGTMSTAHSTSSTSNSLLAAQPHLAQTDARTGSTSPHRDRGRRHARFSLAIVSNALLDAVKERVHTRSNSPHARAGKERAVTPAASRDRSPDGRGVDHAQSRMRDASVDAEGERARSSARDEDGLKHKEKERSTLERISGALGLDVDGGNGDGENWKEFRKGTYTYPISFAIPADSPPSLQCDFGSVTYRLKATVHRPGAFTHRLTATREVSLIASPGEDDLDESDNIVVQREWEAQMLYMIIISGRAFPIGSIMPIHITFMPIAKLRIFRVAAVVEEYFSQFRRVSRGDVVRRFELLSLRYPDRDGPSLLPMETGYENSPLRGFVDAPDESEAASSLMGPGPWSIEANLQLPKSCAKMHFTNKHKRSNIKITHILKIIFRVERGDDAYVDAKTGQRKQFDIVVQTPIHILSCRCNPEWTSLPRYSCFASDAHSKTQACPCTHKRASSTVIIDEVEPAMLPPIATGPHGPSSSTSHHLPFHSLLHHFEPHSETPSPDAQASPGSAYVSGQPLERRPSETPSDIGSLYRNNTLFARLIAGEESEHGEAPPRYERVASLENAHGALASAAVISAHR